MSQNVQLIYRVIDAFNRRDLDSFLALCDPDGEYFSHLVELEGGGPYRGHDGIRNWWEDLLAFSPDFRVQVDEARDLGDLTVARARAHGHAMQSDVHIEQTQWHVTEWRHGMAVWGRVFLSEAEALEAAGLREWAMSQENVELVDRMVKRFNEGGIEAAVSEFMAEGVEFREPPEQPGARVARGRDATVDYFAAFDETWAEHRSDPEEIRALGPEKVLLLSVERFRGRDGIEVAQPAGTIFTVRHGKVVHWQAFWSRETALEAAGLEE